MTQKKPMSFAQNTLFACQSAAYGSLFRAID